MFQQTSKFKDIVRSEGFSAAVSASLKYAIPHPHNIWISMVQEEISKGIDIKLPLSKRVYMYRNGFLTPSWYLYGFNYGSDMDCYLTEFQQKAYTLDLNGEYKSKLDNKIEFYEMIQKAGYSSVIPAVYGEIQQGRFDGDTDLVDLLHAQKKIIIKDLTGSSGSGVFVCESEANQIMVNGDQISKNNFSKVISELDGYIVTEYCQQREYASKIYPRTPNTIRALTINPDRSEPYIAAAVHRFGSDKSGAVDNFSQGGLSAGIDLDSGELSSAVQFPSGSKFEHFEKHPDTNEKICGISIPGWENIRKTLLNIVSEISVLRYVGWDILVTDDGFVLIEGNNQSDVDLLQVHKPLLEDDRTKSFYYDSGVISRNLL